MAVGSAHAVDPDDLLPLFPNEVNSVAVINVAGIIASPRAAKEGWDKLEHTEYLSGAVPVNPSVERMMLAKEFSPGAPTKNWPTSLIPLKNPVDLEKFAKAYSGEVVSLADSTAVLVGQDTYAVAVKPNILGIKQASNKQEIGRWVRSAKDATQSKFPRYINGAVRGHGTSHHIMLALDTEDLLDAQNVGLAVALSKLFGGPDGAKQSKEVQHFFAKMRGLRAMIMLRDVGLTVDLYLESVFEAKPDPAALKAFVIEWMGNYGASLEDLPAADATLKEGILRLSFKLNDAELAHLMAFFLPPLASVGESNTLAVTPVGISPELSAKYYRTVNSLLDELRKKKIDVKDGKKNAIWYDTAAAKIATLSIIGIDKDVVAYAHGAAARLRAIADSLRGVPVKAEALAAKAYDYQYTTVSMFFNGRSFVPMVNPFNSNTNYAEVQAEIDRVVAKDEQSRKALWETIERQRSDIRQAMAEKYKLDFDTPPKR